MKDIYIKEIASALGVKPWQVLSCSELLEEGATVPFISRYRKEKTGSLSDVEVSEVKRLLDTFSVLEKRKETVLKTIQEAGALTDELSSKIETCVDERVLEDIYLPFRPKRKTRASEAARKGLGPLADKMLDFSCADPASEAERYLGPEVEAVEDALAGARDIIAERVSENAKVRGYLRQVYEGRNLVSRPTRKVEQDPSGASKYRQWLSYSEPLSRIAPHRLLALARAQNEGFLNLSIDASEEKSVAGIFHIIRQDRRYPSKPLEEQLKNAISDSFSRLLDPSITNETISVAKQKADRESIRIFGENLSQLLLSPPVGQKRTLAIDPGFRTGCKVVCLNEHGDLLHNETIFPHPPQSEKVKSIQALESMVGKFGIEVIAIGSGTASRETVEFVEMAGLDENVRVYVVSEDGASIYSASDVAREEFPDKDVTVRGAVSIGRRVMDPLAELVKIDPKSLGVGQYQYDVDQTLLKEQLDSTVESCVNKVGVNLNTASIYILRYISGIGPALASNIVQYRSTNGAFLSRRQLHSVPRLGDKAFEQCAGFLRISGGENPLDNSAVHPEAYGLVHRIAEKLSVSVEDLIGNVDLLASVKPEEFTNDDFGLPTIKDILSELAKPGRDPRGEAEQFSFSKDIRSIEDLQRGMVLPGIVTNITAFGAFVNIGIKTNGLLHVSRMGAGRNADPSKIVSLHQHINVRVEDVDLERGRISLGLVK